MVVAGAIESPECQLPFDTWIMTIRHVVIEIQAKQSDRYI